MRHFIVGIVAGTVLTAAMLGVNSGTKSVSLADVRPTPIVTTTAVPTPFDICSLRPGICVTVTPYPISTPPDICVVRPPLCVTATPTPVPTPYPTRTAFVP